MSFNFDYAWERIEKEIPFKDEWNNGTGYLDGLINEDLGLAPNEQVKSFCPKTKRKILITSYGVLGNVVIFERYSKRDRGIIVGNCKQCLERLIGLGTQVSNDDIGCIFHGVPSQTTYSKLIKVIDLYNKLELKKVA